MRELRAVRDDQVIGTVDYADGNLVLTGAAEGVFANLRKIAGEHVLGPDLIKNGWSNGWLYLGPNQD